ncbi:YugN family protein [Bacillus sp. 03113]|uniref:YugN family protein n=1 Tax=Bacillus sp. 03113 TaxID=2578211 RepID=UPI001142CEAC|nr:YugN family protein [Bacillus sp. 03113]
MKFHHSGIQELKADLNQLDETMLANGLVREGQWDYERVTYDRKFERNDGVYYLRIQGYSTKGDIGANKAVIQLLSPLLAKHYYPHGLEYGDGENFPSSLIDQCERILSIIEKEVTEYAI